MSLGEGDSKPKRYVSLIQRSLNRMSHQVEDVLDYLRTSPLNKNVNSCLEAIQAVVDLSNVPENVTVITPQNDLHISFDVRKIEIVFINLLKNAVQAIGKRQGAITISISQEGEFGVVEFEDSAGALSEVNLTRIFDPLFTTKQEGTGLGLSSCKNIVEQHGGKIQVLLNPTRFRVYLPMKQM
jgi:signal transduction histidine kinase